jgi:hypothetical protein
MEGKVSPFWQWEQLFERKGLYVVFILLNSSLLSSAFFKFFLTTYLSLSMLNRSYFNLHDSIVTFEGRSFLRVDIKYFYFLREYLAQVMAID